MDIQQNTLYLLTPGSYVSRDHLTLYVEVPVYPAELAPAERTRENAVDWKKVSIPIHHLESLCVFGPSTVTAPALDLCWEHGVAVNYLSEFGRFQARLTGVADTSVTLRRTQFRVADDAHKSAGIARQMVAGKIQNARNSLLRAARENDAPAEQAQLEGVIAGLARQIRLLAQVPRAEAAAPSEDGLPEEASAGSPEAESLTPDSEPLGRSRREEAQPSETCLDPVAGSESLLPSAPPVETATRAKSVLDRVRGAEGLAAQSYFSVFGLMLKQQRETFVFRTRNRRPPRDRVNCLLSFLYALVRHDCIAALTSAGLDPFVGFLHVDRPNRPSLALDLMEEFRPWLADRLAVTLINRQQIGAEHFHEREGGAVELTEPGRKLIIKSYQERKQERLNHPLLDQHLRVSQLPFVQARILARHLRGDLAAYLPLVPK